MAFLEPARGSWGSGPGLRGPGRGSIRARPGLGRFSPGPRGRLRPRAGGRSDPRCPAASRCPGHDERPPGAAPACGPDPWAVLLRPGRGPRRPRAEEAGKEARRRERGMIHPREPESETPQSGNSLAWADEGSERTVCPARSCVPHWQSPASSPGPSPAVGEGGGLFWRSGKESWTKSAAASSVLTGGSRPERVFPESSSSLSCCSSSAG